MKESRQLYCCSSYYQVLIALMKILVNRQRADLLLEVHGIETAEVLSGRIRELMGGSVKRVLICPDSDAVDPYTQKWCPAVPWQRRRLLRHMEAVFGGIDPDEEYSQIHVFWDPGYAGTWLNIRGLSYRLHEDSLDSYQRIRELRPRYRYIFRQYSPQFLLKKYLRAGVIPFGFSPCCSAVEVNDLRDIQIPPEKVEACPRKQLEDSLTDGQKQIIFRIFAGTDTVIPVFSGREILLLTEPFAVSGRLQDEETQIRMYRQILRDYAANRPVIIKAHPRDCADYGKYFPDTFVMEKNLPMEILNFLPGFRPYMALTVTSSAVFSVPGAGQTVSLGAEYLRQYQQGNRAGAQLS